MPVSKSRRKKGRARQPGEVPEKKRHDPSPKWYTIVMFGLMALGTVLVVVRYMFELDTLWLLAGLIAIGAGFVMTTNFH